ncbi:GntR family transcriptional regulator [Clostridium sp. AM58-1XD]|uniref:GntR family transcriptional regulator n=1 Tax=Clostridium sp. AM58-1XD TaxID=2292307 RepID=UPI0015F70244|nr:GntR family transcriptional regulator [Clostridium sp. AM58-1XD]
MKRFIKKQTPLYINVRNAILEALKSGELVQDGRLPSEDTLASTFSVSRPTIRSALQLLENDGLISKRHGSETVVNSICLNLRMRIDEAQGYWQLIENSGHKPGLLSVSLEPVQLKGSILKRMDLSEETPGYLLKKIYTADGSPVIFNKEYIPENQWYRIPKHEELGQDSVNIFDLSDLYFKQPISYSALEISSIVPTAEVEEAMNFSSDTSFVYLEELHYSAENEPVAFSKSVIRDSLIRVQVVRRRFT